MYRLVITSIFVFLGFLNPQARGDHDGIHRPYGPEQPLVPVIEGSMDCPNPGPDEALGGVNVEETPLIRPLSTGKTQGDLAIFATDLMMLERVVDEKVTTSFQNRDLPRFDPLPENLLPMDVIGGRYLSVRDYLYMNEALVRIYFSRWFRIFAASGDAVATPTDKNKQLHICFGFYSGRNSFTLMDRRTLTDFHIARGVEDFARNTSPERLDYIWEYTVLSHELGHLLLALHQKTRQGNRGMPDKTEELRADCISGYMLGTLLLGGMADARRERITRGFAEATYRTGRYAHGTWEERSKAAMVGFVQGGFMKPQKSRIVLTSGDLVNFCVGKFPGT